MNADWKLALVCVIGLLTAYAIVSPIPTECSTTLVDNVGIKHELVGKINFVCPVRNAC